jgi:hypothetical protein
MRKIGLNIFHTALVVSFSLCSHFLSAQNNLVSYERSPDSFELSASGKSTSLYADANDYPGVMRAVTNLQTDIKAVTDSEPLLITSPKSLQGALVIAGTIGKNALIDQLIKNKKLDVADVNGKWETFIIQVVDNPFPKVKRALVIVGSDKRGTIYGVYELSKQIGVSPWYWWADVPVKKSKSLFVNPIRYYSGEPAVKYRGIFLNDEEPALGRWAVANYGGFNHQFYEKVFELLLRSRANFLWPAMWWASFNSDDPLNPKLADEYGIVMGTSHHEPMSRAHAEWKPFQGGAWNYENNETKLRDFWTQGIKRMGSYETLLTIGMRGDGDEAMTDKTNIALLERIVKDQREIITQTTGKKANDVPQVWALYKEVQDYYDQGMRVPDDVTLLLCDDNWGNVRKLPKLTEQKRAGGYGIYYHFDYVGGPRNYKWVNTNSLPRIWEQMNLSYQYGADRVWIVNVGDLKPMEFPISFFLDYAWAPNKIGAGDLQNYTEQWCAQQFGVQHAKEIAECISQYGKLNARIKPELLNEETYSLENYDEFVTVLNEYKSLRDKALALQKEISIEQQEAFYQLVLHPALACTNLYEMYYYVALNHKTASLNQKVANEYADKAKELFKNDSLITLDYHSRNNGKWNKMMSQTHIGYTYWQQPPFNKMPEVKYVVKGVDAPQPTTLASKASSNLIPKGETGNIFYERDGYICMAAEHFTKAVNTPEVTWTVLSDHGRTGSSITPFPVTVSQQQLSAVSPHVTYTFYSSDEGKVTLQLYFSPTLNFNHSVTGTQYAISIDDETPQIVSLNKEDVDLKTWEGWVASNINIKTSSHQVVKPGKHVVKYWMIDPGAVLQKLVLNFGGLKPSYLGPPETLRR